MKRVQTIQDVVNWRLCLGCGACAYVCPEKNIRLTEVFDQGIRPFVVSAKICADCTECLSVCPAYENDHTPLLETLGVSPELVPFFGPVLEIWEGHATDQEVRFSGSSGGTLTALALFCLEKAGMYGALHIAQAAGDPLKNETVLSQNRSDLLARTGSRYAPASACDRLDLIENATGPCVFIGQPSEVTGAAKARPLKPALDRNLGLMMSFFCAGSPSTKGTLELLKAKGIDPGQVQSLRYRGRGWPGMFSVILKGQEKPALEMTYKESWSFLQAFRPFSVHLCPDGSGEDADISCGDPWYRKVQPGEPGSSLVLVRTERGRDILRRAMAAGYLTLTPADMGKVIDSQRNLIQKRGAIWGRILALKLFGLPAPRLTGFSLFRNWWDLPVRDKLRSTFGTVRRIISRKYYKPLLHEPIKSRQGDSVVTR